LARTARGYTLYVAIKENVGYESRLAVSDDLVRWTPLADALPFRGEGWDRWQAAGSYDLVHWTKWTGEGLVAPSEPWDETYLRP
jgi:hypothetical protein